MYKASVITPFHDVDMGMFQKCADSMRCKTLGFENIEWIIVVHNCQPHYLPMLTEMFKDDRNVMIKVLNGWSDMMEILRSNAMTDYGRHYHFDQIETLDDYQQLVVSNNASLYRYVTDHVVCTHETQMDKILFTIY